jgi:integrase
MASLSSTKRNGKTCFQVWIGAEPNRRNIWLGTISKTRANEIVSYVVQLESATDTNTQLGHGAKEWIRGLDDRFHAKLVKVGLTKPRASDTVKAFFAERLKSLTCAARTRDIYQRAHNKFFEFMGDDRNLRDVTPKMAHDFYHVHLLESGIADSYRCKIAKVIREFFDKALTFELIDRNPFAGFEIACDVDRSRHVYIDRPDILDMIHKAVDSRWRCLFGFAGLCGLRSRSELAAIRWEDIHWDDNTFTVPKVKTKARTVPIFGDFRPLLEAYHRQVIGPDMQTIATGRIFPHCPSQTQLARKLNQTIAKAGMQPWPRPYMNLRSSCETYLIRQGFDLTTVTTWLGNSPRIAQQHYLQVTPGDIAKAAGIEKFSNSFQHTVEQGSTVAKNPVI